LLFTPAWAVDAGVRSAAGWQAIFQTV